MKKYLILTSIYLLISCGTNQESTSYNSIDSKKGGGIYLGEWTMNEIKNPKYSYYSYNYSISKNGEAYKVHVLVTCPKCGPTIKPIEYNYSGFYNAEKSRFEIQKEGFFESFTIDQSNGKAMSDRFPKFLFTKLNNK